MERLKPLHHVFTVDYLGRTRELRTEGTLQNPFTEKTLNIKNAIWDTGATSSAISIDIAKLLDLEPIDRIMTHTANGSVEADAYIVNFMLPSLKANDKVRVKNLKVTEGNLGPHTDMLIGMDIIGAGDFIVQNDNGKTSFSFCIPPFENKWDMIEKAEIVNQRISKHNQKKRK